MNEGVREFARSLWRSLGTRTAEDTFRLAEARGIVSRVHPKETTMPETTDETTFAGPPPEEGIRPVNVGPQDPVHVPEPPPPRPVTLGRIVRYTLSADDAREIARRRADARATLYMRGETPHPCPGAVMHYGNDWREGHQCAAMVVQPWGAGPDDGSLTPNLHVFLDGNDTLWRTSVAAAREPTPGHWHWPPVRA